MMLLREMQPLTLLQDLALPSVKLEMLWRACQRHRQEPAARFLLHPCCRDHTQNHCPLLGEKGLPGDADLQGRWIWVLASHAASVL